MNFINNLGLSAAHMRHLNEPTRPDQKIPDGIELQMVEKEQSSRLFWLSKLDLSYLIQMSPKPFRVDLSRVTWDLWQALIGTWPGSWQFPDVATRSGKSSPQWCTILRKIDWIDPGAIQSAKKKWKAFSKNSRVIELDSRRLRGQ